MKAGIYTIKWRHHLRDTKQKMSKVLDPNDRSYTMCVITDNYGRTRTQSALCHPQDNFCKETGRKLSLAKAMDAMSMTKEERKEIWEAYRNMVPGGRW